MRGGTSHGRLLRAPDPLPSSLRPAGGPRELASLKHARGPDPRPVLANSSGSPGVLGGGSRDVPPHPRPASFSIRQGAAFGGRGLTERRVLRTHAGESRARRWDSSLGPSLQPGSERREGCPASGVRARAGPRTAPRAGRRIRRARVFDERSEEFALAPAARAAEPMRVARAEEPPWDIPPARDSCGTMKWTGTGLFSPVSGLRLPPTDRQGPQRPPAAQTATGVTCTSRPSPFTAFETMQYFSASASVFATSASRSARSAAGT